MDSRRLSRADLPPDTAELARFLVGKTLVHDSPEGRTAGRIVETEAYVVGDAAGHGFRGPTARNRSMFLRRGHAYVYLIYGMWFCLNVSGETEGVGAGVLFRALEPIEGLDLMARRRGSRRIQDLARGPGRLAAAMGVDLRQDGLDLCGPSPLWLGHATPSPAALGESVRIGLTKEADRVLRFYERGSPFVSGPAKLRV
jgi:DNA-3-methyladenine glycosylase